MKRFGDLIRMDRKQDYMDGTCCTNPYRIHSRTKGKDGVMELRRLYSRV
jgi:hypothetical protein